MKTNAPTNLSDLTRPVAGLLLAGGRSRRMGRDKVQLDWHGRPLGEHQAATLAATGVSPLFISCRPDQPWTPPGFLRLEDRTESGGALAALVESLAAIPAEFVLVMAIDLPLVQPAWLESLVRRACAGGVSVVPRTEHRFEPLAAVWHRSALSVLDESLVHGESLQQACAKLQNEKILYPEELGAEEAACLDNLNTPADAVRLGLSA